MSLKIWLPLNGTLENKGVSNINIVNENATINTAGKIGSCYSFNGSGYRIHLSGDDLFKCIKGGNQPFSIAMWVFHEDSRRAILFGDYNSTGAINVNIELTTGHIVRFYWGRNPDYNTGVNIGASVWSHLTMTYDGNKLCTYLNGVLAATNNITLSEKNKTSGEFFLGRDSRTSETALKGRLNDFRVYDHCLSAAEVHEISQGLVLHYKMNEGAFTQQNLIKNGYGEDTTNWGSPNNVSTDIPSGYPEIKKSIYSNTTKEYLPIDINHTYQISVFLKNTATSGTTYPSIYPYDIDKKFISTINYSFNSSTLTTLSQELKPGDTKIYVTDLSKWNAASGHYYNHAAIFNYTDGSGYTWPVLTYTQNTAAFGSGSGEKTNLDKTNNIITLRAAYNGPKMPVGTQLCASTEGGTYHYPFGGISKSSINNWTQKTATFTPKNDGRLKFMHYLRYSTYDNTLHAGIKLIDLTLDRNILQDSSGYNYNSSLNDIAVLSPNSARYSSTTFFGAYNTPSSTLINTALLSSLSNCTITYWCKHISYPTLLFTGQTTSYYLMASNNNTYYHSNAGTIIVYKDGVAGSYKAVTNEWHFFALTGVNLSTWTQLKINSYSSGWPLNSYISDLRIYNTQLSALDIKQLYELGAKVDNKGRIHSYEFDELY